MTFFSVIIATLGVAKRPSLREALRSLRSQTFRDFEVLTDDSPPNEYVARNKCARRARGEVLAFMDDDCVAPVDWLQKAYKYFSENSNLQVLTGPVEGDLYGWGRWIRVSQPFWGIGCNLFIRKKAFLEVGGFEEDWGLKQPTRGWRADSDILYRLIDRFGVESYVHAEDVVMTHPQIMKSSFIPEVEERFYLRHRDKILKWIAPYDPRLCMFILATGIEKDENIKELLRRYRVEALKCLRSHQ